MGRLSRVAWFGLAALLLAAWPASAQLKFGDFSSDLSGVVSSGYTGDYGNQTSSSHSWEVGGSGTLSGFFYNPNFVSFNASPYVNQSRANSNFQSISDASGVNFSSSIFGGSHFPGSISYAKAYNSEGNYAVPGLANFTTHGNSDTLAINWNETLPDEPSLSLGFSMGGSEYSVYGSNDDGSSKYHSFSARSGYTVLGFGLGAYFSTSTSNSMLPQVATGGEGAVQTQSGDTAYGVNMSHPLPIHGSFSLSANRSDFNSEYLGTTTSGTVDTVGAAAGMQPTDKLHFSANANYSDNLDGQLIQSIVAAGGVVPGTNTSQSSHSIDMLGQAVYTPFAHFEAGAFVERRMQEYLGQSYGADSFGGNAVYGRFFWGGNFNAAASVAENTVDNSNSNFVSFSGNVSYSRRIDGFVVTGSFGYAQDMQTLLVTYSSSFYSYSGNVRRRWGQFTAGVGASGGRTGLTGQSGASNTNESFSANVGYSRYLTATASYSKANGSAILTGAGLVQQPQPVPIPGLMDLFGGKSYSFGLSSSPAKKLTIAATFGEADSNIVAGLTASSNKTEQYNALFQYQLRKMYITGGYSRLQQGFSASGLPPEVISSFYMGVSRWFNFF
ncbi:MAG: hypothetical protein WAL71_09625 [Terriglobales bacterium]